MPTITAAVAREQGKPLTLEQLQLDDSRPDKARGRMVATGICTPTPSWAMACTRRRCPPC